MGVSLRFETAAPLASPEIVSAFFFPFQRQSTFDMLQEAPFVFSPSPFSFSILIFFVVSFFISAPLAIPHGRMKHRRASGQAWMLVSRRSPCSFVLALAFVCLCLFHRLVCVRSALPILPNTPSPLPRLSPFLTRTRASLTLCDAPSFAWSLLTVDHAEDKLRS